MGKQNVLASEPIDTDLCFPNFTNESTFLPHLDPFADGIHLNNVGTLSRFGEARLFVFVTACQPCLANFVHIVSMQQRLFNSVL